MQWKTHGERQIYTNPWVNLCLVDVQQPDGRRWEYHVVRLRHLAVAAVVNDRREVLMMWRHRFITDAWAWELPMGLVEDGESPEEAAAREVLEETGWRPGPIKPLIYAGKPTGSPIRSTMFSAWMARPTPGRPRRRTSPTASSGSPSPRCGA